METPTLLVPGHVRMHFSAKLPRLMHQQQLAKDGRSQRQIEADHPSERGNFSLEFNDVALGSGGRLKRFLDCFRFGLSLSGRDTSFLEPPGEFQGVDSH
jgi:hypothetical protein